MHLKTLIVAVAALAALGAANAQQDSPNCEYSCGNVNIAYPFGSREECYHSPDFLVTCNRSSGEPIPYFRESNIIISNISTDKSEMEIMAFVAHDCYNVFGRDGRNRPSLTSSNFPISAKNKFVAIGCDTYAYFSGRRGDDSDIGSGCISICDRNSLTNGSCSGVGCCEVAVPEGLRYVSMSLSSYYNHTNITDFNPCSYGFFVEQGKFDFSTTYLLDFERKMPMLLDWAIGNLTCEEAKSTDHNFLCKRNSECDQDYKGPGYRCRCKEGYEGNPYNKDAAYACKNVNECERGTHDCEHDARCDDYPQGNYTCICPKGFSGDGRKNGTGCTADKSNLIKIVVGISASAAFLLIFITWLYLILKKRKLMMLREKFFKQNGGIMLQQRISRDGGSHDQAKVFTLEELKRATNNYDESRIIGKGGYGTVYKGVLSDDRIVAIKRSKLGDQTQAQIEQFINEVVVRLILIRSNGYFSMCFN